MKVHGKGSIQQMEPDKPKSRCRKWRIWVQTETGRKSRRFTGTYTMAQETLDAMVSDLSGRVQNEQAFAGYADAWLRYISKTGDYEANTLANYARVVRSINRSPLGERRMDSITTETCREDLLWIKEHPQSDLVKELSGTSMHKVYTVLGSILKQAVDDKKMASNPLEKLKPPKTDTPEKEALPWDELMKVLDRLDDMPLNAFAMALYLIACLGLRRAEACALMDADVFEDRVVVRYAIKEADGTIGEPKSKAGIRTLPMMPRLWRKVCEWRQVKASKGLADALTLANDAKGGVIRPQNLYKWWKKVAPDLGCEGISLHQLRHSNLTRMARHMSLFDLMRYAGWSSPEPAQIYVHDDYSALVSGVESAWDEP